MCRALGKKAASTHAAVLSLPRPKGQAGGRHGFSLAVAVCVGGVWGVWCRVNFRQGCRLRMVEVTGLEGVNRTRPCGG